MSLDSYIPIFHSILSAEEIILPSSPQFLSHSRPWSLSYDKHPKIVLAPSTLEGVQATVKCLCESDLDFAVRGRGVGSSSATDVILSMKAFDEIAFDEERKIVQLGAGLDWGQVDEKLATLAPGYVVVGARCPYVGVTGSTLHGGLSWLSHELGLGSDPSNMLDAQIVLADGRILWASSEPDLLWALRGGGGNFGVVTALRLRAHKYTTTIFSGMITYPASALHYISTSVAHWTHTHHDPKTALHLFLFDFSQRTLHGEAATPQLVALIFDARGEAHARGPDGFAWALGVPGAVEQVREMRLAEVHELQRSTEASHGTARSWLQAALVGEIDEGTVVRAWEWYEDVTRETPELALGTFALLEIMQEPAMCSAPANSTAWPHGSKGRQHVLQLSVGGPLPPLSTPSTSSPTNTSSPTSPSTSSSSLAALKTTALHTLSLAPSKITNISPHPPSDFLPNFLLENHDVAAVFGGNWGRLRAVKGRYDPRGRFWGGGIRVVPLVGELGEGKEMATPLVVGEVGEGEA